MFDAALKLTQRTVAWFGAVDAVDLDAARRRVQAMQARFPEVEVDRLHAALVQAKCLQAGALATAAASAGLIPGVGGLLAALLGPLADTRTISLLQAELIAETFALYGVDLPAPAERAALLALSATHRSAQQAGQGLVRAVSARARARLGSSLAARALPVAEVLTALASQVATTYAIGMRARALCKLRDAPAAELPERLRALAMIDERRLVVWTRAAAGSALELAQELGQRWFARLEEVVPDLTRLPSTRSRASARAAKASPPDQVPRSLAPARRARGPMLKHGNEEIPAAHATLRRGAQPLERAHRGSRARRGRRAPPDA